MTNRPAQTIAGQTGAAKANAHWAASSQKLYQRLQTKRFVFAGPCVLESFDLALQVARAVAEAARQNGLLPVFKSSYDKANRTSGQSFRGPGLEKGLAWLAEIKAQTGLPIITDIHAPEQAAPVAEVADILQIPAFLCRQTSLLQAAGATGRVVNIKKGQFVAPADMLAALDKVRQTGNNCVMLTERGTFFGYHNLVVDFRSLAIMRDFGVPVVFDATHSVQLPGAGGSDANVCSGGERRFVPCLARAAAAAGASGVFLECHPEPDQALCDGPNSWPLAQLPALLAELKSLWSVEHAC